MTAIEFENISKQYRLGLVSTKTLSHDLNRWWQTSILGKEDPYLKIGETNDRATKGESEYVWALKDINFKIEQGDVVGIIGKNGAGKSTLLKLLSRVTGPTTGTIRARGRIASLLEVGTGFHQEMTGRENIYLNGAIMGMTKREIDSKLDEIVDFSGCERYLDTPVKRYSSGMTVRLGFAVAAHLDPEILVVDEVLAVGDAEFQKKAIGKMQDVAKGEGRTVLFVSHNIASMKQLCKTGILLEHGQIAKTGLMNDVISYYQHQTDLLTHNSILERCDRVGNGKLRLNKIVVRNEHDIPVDRVISGNPIVISIYLSNISWNNFDEVGELSIGINDEYGERSIVMNNIFKDYVLRLDSTRKEFRVDFMIDRFPLNVGEYGMAFYLSDKFGNVIDWIDHIHTIEVEAGDFYNTGKVHKKGLGHFLTDYELQIIE